MLAAAHHLVKALESNNRCTNDDVRKLLADLTEKLSLSLSLRSEAKTTLEAKLFSASRTIMNLNSNHAKIWDDSSTIVEYIGAVTEVQKSIEYLESMPLRRGSPSKGLCDQAQIVLQMAMERLEEELIYILMQNKQCFYVEEESIDESHSHSHSHIETSSCSEAEEYYCGMDFIHPDLIPRIKSIADIMFSCGYGQEFCRAFNAFWRDTLSEYLTFLDVEHLGIEDVLQMEWKDVNSRIRNWRFAINRIVVVYLARVKRLFDQMLGDASSSCLLEASKACLLCLVNFGQAVAIGPHEPHWLFCMLDMFEGLATIIPDLNALFPGEETAVSLLKFEFRELLMKLGNSSVVIFKEFGSHIAMRSSTAPLMNGTIHPLTKYVVNYILHAGDYVDTLRSLLKDENEDGEEYCAVGIHLKSMTAALEANLDKKSELYKQSSSLKHIFMLNNIHYIVDRIRKSKISGYLGDNWIRDHMARYRRDAMSYQRLTWNPIVELLREGGGDGAGLKGRCQEFALAFEEAYKIQTRWHVPDALLGDELRISVTKWIIPVYRKFVSEVTRHIGEKHIKYSELELGFYILDLLQGLPKSLNHHHHR